MSKAILILEKMPKSCEKCRICNGIDCAINGWVVCSDEGQTNRISRCPLKHLPQKRMPKDNGKQGLLKLIEQCFDIGYNACLDEILLGEE